LRNLDGQAQPSPNAIPVVRKIKKSAQDHALPAPVIGRADGELSGRTTMVQGEQPADSAYDKSIGQTPLLAGECAHFTANAKHL
jgi:hypothetical protein